MQKQYLTETQAADEISAGGVVALPTETVYGLAARVFSESAVNRVFELKQRPANNPLIVHVSTIEQVQQLATMSELEHHIASAFWPGPLTIVLQANNAQLPKNVTASLDTVAVRMPNNKTMLNVISLVGEPLAAPSANVSGKPSATHPDHVIADFAGRVAVVDGGQCSGGIESTVIRVIENEIVVLRPGAITASELAIASGCAVRNMHASEAGVSPGTQHRHYAPNATVSLVTSIDDIQRLAANRDDVLVLSTNPIADVGLWRKLEAETFYSLLRYADDLHVKEILVLCDDTVRVNEGLFDRIQRASER